MNFLISSGAEIKTVKKSPAIIQSTLISFLNFHVENRSTVYYYSINIKKNISKTKELLSIFKILVSSNTVRKIQYIGN
jgi:hypothetical protein